MYEQVMDLHELFQFLNITNFTLVGYSMGGRIALSLCACIIQSMSNGLVLESASPGLQSEAEQTEHE